MHPFNRHLVYFASKSPNDKLQTPYDSLRGYLSIGLNFPVACILTLGLHVLYRNTGLFSFAIDIPAVRTTRTMLVGLPLEQKEYSGVELARLARPHGVKEQMGAVGMWVIAADAQTGRVSREDVELYQKGELMERLEARRRDRRDVVPWWRGGPIGVAGHSYFVEKLFGVYVYRDDRKEQ
ncbi:hypothetical protein LTR66_011063 [Elasticomyces elasticus]|nr:hypothetical protein LTR66_011063 [Elasticomyces elasticus]